MGIMGIFLIVMFLVTILCVVQKKQYEKTEYYQQTPNSYISVQFILILYLVIAVH